MTAPGKGATMYELTRADFEEEAEPWRDHLPTRPMSPLEVEELVEPERRYTPEPGEIEDEPVAPAAHTETRRRTLRMRVLDFKPLVRPD